MPFTIGQVISWLIVGLLAGSLTGMILTRSRRGYGRWINWGIGLAGALIGNVVFSLLRVDFGLSSISVSLADIVQAFIGAILVVGVVTLVRRSMRTSADSPES